MSSRERTTGNEPLDGGDGRAGQGPRRGVGWAEPGSEPEDEATARLAALVARLPDPLRAAAQGPGALVFEPASVEPPRPPFISESAAAILGYGVAELCAESELFVAHVHPEDLARVRSSWKDRSGPAPLTLAYRAVARDGHLVYLRETRVAGADGVAGVLLDVSEQEAPARALAAALLAEGPRETLLCFCTALAQSFALARTGFLDAKSGRLFIATHGPLGARHDVTEEPAHVSGPFTRLGERALARRELCLSPRGNSFALPIGLAGFSSGALLGSAELPLRLAPPRERTLEALGAAAAIALQRAELKLELRRGEEKRKRSASTPPPPRDLGVALAELADRLSRPGFQVGLQADAPARVNDRVAAAALDLVREALAFAFRHAQALRADVQLTLGESELVLQVTIDDRGSAPPDAGEQARAHASLQEAAAAAGGALTVEASASGTCVRATLPLQAAG